MSVIEELRKLQDKGYIAKQYKVTPTVDPARFIGIRVPVLRAYAKKFMEEGKYENFLLELPHRYFDEDMLHAILISELKDYDKCIQNIDTFLPYVDNWAVCDTIIPKAFKNNKDSLVENIKMWSASSETYTIRFGIKTLMSFFLDDAFAVEYLAIPALLKSNEYYVNMMRAWYFATALAKQWDDTILLLENNVLDRWTHNKTIQKARESYRITEEQKAFLNTLRIK